MGRYDGEYYDYPKPCREGSHTHEMNGTCHKCGIMSTYDGLSEGEGERRRYKMERDELWFVLKRLVDKHHDPRSSLWREAKHAVVRFDDGL